MFGESFDLAILFGPLVRPVMLNLTANLGQMRAIPASGCHCPISKHLKRTSGS
ncbi:MAG: hypothetical protein GDA36_02975 [Rhodobacteraceae bacterium]|nr:hypothetical protein [Paracoccaceae bacterium]